MRALTLINLPHSRGLPRLIGPVSFSTYRGQLGIPPPNNSILMILLVNTEFRQGPSNVWNFMGNFKPNVTFAAVFNTPIGTYQITNWTVIWTKVNGQSDQGFEKQMRRREHAVQLNEETKNAIVWCCIDTNFWKQITKRETNKMLTTWEGRGGTHMANKEKCSNGGIRTSGGKDRGNY